jgi:hypothetical protein
MSGHAAGDSARMRERDRRRVRWPILGIVVVLGLLLALTTTLEQRSPRSAASAPAVVDLPLPLSDAPVRCTRTDDRARLDELRDELREDGRLTSALATACPRLLDGRRVLYVGEVVGDILRREGGAWVQLNDDAYALEVGPMGAHRERRGFSTGLAVWLPDGLHEDLGAPGRHGRRGAIVQVEGVFLRADPADGGGMGVRADTATVITPPVAIEEPLDRPLIIAASAAALAALASGAWARQRARRRER